MRQRPKRWPVLNRLRRKRKQRKRVSKKDSPRWFRDRGNNYFGLNTRLGRGLAGWATSVKLISSERSRKPATGSSRPPTGTRVVVTGKDGKARVSFKAPSALSEYRITARGVTGADTLAGQTTATLTVRKSFFVDLKVPASLTQGDKPRFVGQVHHTGVTGKLALGLTVYAGGARRSLPQDRSRSRRTESTKSCSIRLKSPRARSVRLDAQRHDRRHER